MMMQAADIERYLVSDTIFHDMNKFISTDSDDIDTNNKYLKKDIEINLIKEMKQISPLFNKTYKRIVWAGSYYKGTRVGLPEEYDINLVIDLPLQDKFQFDSGCPGFVKIRTPYKLDLTDADSFRILHILRHDDKAKKELDSLIDCNSYLNQEKFRTWMEAILAKVALKTSGRNEIILDNTTIKTRKAGPAFTLSIKISGKTIDIDIVPVLTFPICKRPPNCSKISILRNYPPEKCWCIVPKPFKNSDSNTQRNWRLCFYEIEKDILSKSGPFIKPIIRHLKKLRDQEEWNIASYYIETLCLHERDMFKYWNRSYTSLFFTMLHKLRDVFHNCRIEYFWDKRLNLLENIGSRTMSNMEGRLNTIIRNIERNISNDPFVIARFVLNKKEFDLLKSKYDNSESKPESEPESEPESKLEPVQRRCIII